MGAKREMGAPNVKWGSTDFKMGVGHHCPPAGDGPALICTTNLL